MYKTFIQEILAPNKFMKTEIKPVLHTLNGKKALTWIRLSEKK